MVLWMTLLLVGAGNDEHATKVQNIRDSLTNLYSRIDSLWLEYDQQSSELSPDHAISYSYRLIQSPPRVVLMRKEIEQLEDGTDATD